MQFSEAMPVGVASMNQRLRRVGDAPAFDRVAETGNGLDGISEVRVEGDVMPVGVKDVVEAALDQDLASAGGRRLEMPR